MPTILSYGLTVCPPFILNIGCPLLLPEAAAPPFILLLGDPVLVHYRVDPTPILGQLHGARTHRNTQLLCGIRAVVIVLVWLGFVGQLGLARSSSAKLIIIEI